MTERTQSTKKEDVKKSAASQPSQEAAPDQIAYLQRTIGNQATVNLVNQRPNAVQRGWFDDAVNAVGDAFDMRNNEAEMDEYEDAVNELEEFKENSPHTTANFQSTTRMGAFDVSYDANNNTLDINCKCQFDFVNGTAAEYPAAPAEELAWTDEAKEQFQNNFLTTCSQAWSAQHTFYCQKDWWESLQAAVNVRFTVVTDNPHFTLTIKKIPPGEFSRSGVYRPRFDADGDFIAGRGEFDSEDLTMVNKPGGQQQAAVHEAGHMLGIDDEYETGSTDDPAHSDLTESEFGHGVARGADGRIMSGGMDVQPEHGVTFLEALKKATNMEEWSTTEKQPRPVPTTADTSGLGDFPTPNSDTQYA